MGRFDEDGFLQIIDRKKDMIISGGLNLYPSDLEAVLLGHPDVAEAAVFGVPSDRWGETPVAAVMLRYDGTITETLSAPGPASVLGVRSSSRPCTLSKRFRARRSARF